MIREHNYNAEVPVHMRRILAVTVTLMALVAVACGSSDKKTSAKSTNTTAAASADTGKLTKVELGYVPFADSATTFLAIENGIFKKHGLDVNVTPAQAPTAIVASMVSGQTNIGFVTTPVLINANAQGTGIKCVSTIDGRQTADAKQDGTVLVASPSSGIKAVKDLAGKKVAVVQLASLNAISVQALAHDAGIDFKSVQLIQLPFPQMPDALKQGRVDAAVIVSPFLQTAVTSGAVEVSHPNVDLWGDGTHLCYAATDKYIAEHEETVKNFSAAMVEATNYTKDHLDEAKATLVKYMQLTPDVAKAQTLSVNFNPNLNVGTIDKAVKVMKDLGLLQKELKATDLVWPGAAAK
jgi:NitT/TauT family transport system substrate-binding protein